MIMSYVLILLNAHNLSLFFNNWYQEPKLLILGLKTFSQTHFQNLWFFGLTSLMVCEYEFYPPKCVHICLGSLCLFFFSIKENRCSTMVDTHFGFTIFQHINLCFLRKWLLEKDRGLKMWQNAPNGVEFGGRMREIWSDQGGVTNWVARPVFRPADPKNSFWAVGTTKNDLSFLPLSGKTTCRLSQWSISIQNNVSFFRLSTASKTTCRSDLCFLPCKRRVVWVPCLCVVLTKRRVILVKRHVVQPWLFL